MEKTGEKMICYNCKKTLKEGMEIEYSEQIGEYFCSPDCATNVYFDYMGSHIMSYADMMKRIKEKG
jgi:hypothetical protein